MELTSKQLVDELAKVTASLQRLMELAGSTPRTIAAEQCLQCGTSDVRSRGLCETCYQRTRARIRRGSFTENEIVDQGLMAPDSQLGGRKPAVRTALDDYLDSRNNTDPVAEAADFAAKAEEAGKTKKKTARKKKTAAKKKG